MLTNEYIYIYIYIFITRYYMYIMKIYYRNTNMHTHQEINRL